ncbi:unnamed protein product [Gemmata massiliana]|uniref:Uncharacterized protein n=1 Tax=Gemmata massiliana TaxID=1210884 RepID=A0A6P2DGL9_9BACT|nr:hypothetical protein [Gemmata massiliana]VTS00915.1 unnamed protein product [Gemmata massiliana]
MAKAKVKFDAKDFLLRKGEILVMGVAGVSLVALLFWGVTKWASAEDPNKIASDLARKSEQVKTNIATGKPTEAELDAIKPAEFIIKRQNNTPARTNDFPVSGPIFDPTAQPSTKRDNPIVFNVGDYQIDLVSGAMPGYDIIYDGDEPMIAVLTTAVKSDLDKQKMKEAVAMLRANTRRGQENLNKIKNSAPKNNQPPGGPGFPPGGPGFPGGPGAPMMPGGGKAGGSMSGPYGMPGSGSGYNMNARRMDEGKVIKYVSLKDIDTAIEKGNHPALTVIPVRMVTIHAVVPYKTQLEEIRRALRLTSDAEARGWGPFYKGFEIQRRETRVLASGKEEAIQEWVELPKDVTSTEGNYKFEEKYIDVIDTRKVADHIDEGYFPYFLKPDMMLSMPLPLLAKDLNAKYPDITLKPILENIKKLEDKNTQKVGASEFAQKIGGNKTREGIEGMYGIKPNLAAGFGYDRENFGGGPRLQLPGTGKPGAPGPMGNPLPGPGGKPGVGIGSGARLPDGYDPYGSSAASDDVENYLLRFVDCDVKPGHTYEYRIRLRMHNPNYGQDPKAVINQEFVKEKYKTLYSKWVYLPTSIPVPNESFLYAYDTKTYREQTVAAYEGQRELLNRMQLKDNQAVVQVASWMEQVRADAGSKHEPVGAWVVTEIPVGRGEYIGRKQHIKLPLWSSESSQYQFREVADKVIPPKGGKEQPQPKGWLVDFSTKSILVDFEGGRVKGKSSVSFDDKGNVVPRTRTFEEEVATEMLIVRQDGKLVVRSSQVDEGDEKRKDVAAKWSDWLKAVETHKGAIGTPGAPGEFNPFDKK